MEFLKTILGDELYGKVEQAIAAHNNNEANKENQIKIGNLGSGEYVGKGKYDSLEAMLTGKTTELEAANNLIAELKKSNKGNEGLQQQISTYEGQVAQLQAELEKTKLESAIKVELLSAKALDVDYLTFKLKEKGELALDENGKIKGWDEKLSSLKTQFPTQFESGGGDSNNGFTPYENNGLPKGSAGNAVTKEQFRGMSFEDRMNLKKSNETLYKQLAKN